MLNWDRSETTFTRGGGYLGGQKIVYFCQCLKGRKCQRRGLGGQKRPKFKKKIFTLPVWETPKFALH